MVCLIGVDTVPVHPQCSTHSRFSVVSAGALRMITFKKEVQIHELGVFDETRSQQ